MNIPKWAYGMMIFAILFLFSMLIVCATLFYMLVGKLTFAPEEVPRSSVITIYVEPTPMPIINPEDVTKPWTEQDVYISAQALEGEAGNCSKLQKSGVMWNILNRVDDSRFPNTIVEVVTARNQYQGYHPTNIPSEESLEIAEDVLARWWLEKTYGYSYGRTLPKEYVYFHGDHIKTNYFTKTQKASSYWDWSWGNPYEED